MERTPWKLVIGGAALVGVVAGGITAAASDRPLDLNDRSAGITLTADGRTPAAGAVDDSPESADSPNESVQDSADSPFDSPGDPGWVDPSPESADSPNESVQDSADSPFDSPDDPARVAVAPAPAPAPTPAPAPAPAPAPVVDDSPSPQSWDSPDSADSD